MTRRLCTLAVMLFLALPAQAQDIESVISDQITAFRADDFATAFTFAAPNIVRMFQTPENFGQMVRNGYPMVYRPQSYAFDRRMQANGVTYQNVLIEGPDGNGYIAEYAMVETENGWKISGVRIFQLEGLGA